MVALGLHCCEWAFLSCVEQGYSLVVVLRLLIVMASLIGVHGLSCPAACEIFPDQGLKLCSLYWQVDSLRVDHQESLQYSIINYNY